MSSSGDRWDTAVGMDDTLGNSEHGEVSGRQPGDALRQRLESLDAYRGLIMISPALV